MTQWGLDTLFNPAKRHMDEEKRRLQSTREEIGDSSGGKRIDLESGRVVIRKAASDDEDDGAEASGDADAADATAPKRDAAAAKKSAAGAQKRAVELTPAQQRALDRRRRPPR